MTERQWPTFLENVLVVELGQRLGAGICGSLLAEAGAEVVCVEVQEGPALPHSKLATRDSLSPGKTRLTLEGGHFTATATLVSDLVRRAQVVLLSSDTDPPWLKSLAGDLPTGGIACDVTAFGRDAGPLAGRALADPLVQALAGAMDTSGEPDGPPAFCAAPIVEMSAALYAASGVMAALRVSRMQGIGQQVEVALYDVAVGMLATFLPRNFAGGSAQRVGNHHPAMSPWNAFAARDGWVLLCAGTNEQWARVAKLIGKPELTTDPRFDSTTKRVANNAEVDATIAPWITQFTVAECVDKLNAISISTGPILEVADLANEPNLAHRRMIRTLTDGKTRVPGSPLRGSIARGITPEEPPVADDGRQRCVSILKSPATPERSPPLDGEGLGVGWSGQHFASPPTPVPSPRGGGEPKPPLAGVRVIEMGQFTTAPLVGRQLGALGAYVAKLEPEGGEPAREMPPHRNGQGFFFSLSNSDTRVMTVDLRKPGRVELLTKLIEKADVLVENTKPGTLARHGFTPERIIEINPRIVYTAISGFGIDAPSAGLGAMDTTVQGLAGIMDLTRVDGVPYKTGISIADLHAGQFALFATLAALEFRDRTGKGQVIDLAMLDAASWVTRTTWNAPPSEPLHRALRCRDGAVLVETHGTDTDWASVAAQAASTDREALIAGLAMRDIPAAPVLSVSEVLAHTQTRERGLVFEAKARDGSMWNLLKSPILLSRTPAEVRRVPGPLNADQDEILRDWEIDWREPTPAS